MSRRARRAAAAPAARESLTALEELPNVGPSIAANLRHVGIRAPRDLVERDPYALYDELCEVTGVRHDPCLLDTFIAAVRYMEGAPPHPWWHYTPERKRTLEARRRSPARSEAAC